MVQRRYPLLMILRIVRGPQAWFVCERVMGGGTLSGPRREEEDFVFISRRRNVRWSGAVRPGPVDGENGCNHRRTPRGHERDHGTRGLLPGGAGSRSMRRPCRRAIVLMWVVAVQAVRRALHKC